MKFAPSSDADVLRLIGEYPLAWVVSCGADGFGATLLPLLAETDATARVVSLFGHFAASNAQVATLQAAPRAAILFLGPNGYISPEHVSQSGWAPTWNYAAVHFDVDVEFVPHANDAALARLVETMERDRREPWTIDKMGPRYLQMVKRIVAFRAHVRSQQARFKLGQDETAQTLNELLSKLPDENLVGWMREQNGKVR